MRELIDKLGSERKLNEHEWLALLKNRDNSLKEYLLARSRAQALAVFGRGIYIRGLIEISNYCRNNCYYCGIRRGNKGVHRYRLTAADIMACCRQGYELGFRSFVLQGGEDEGFGEESIAEIIRDIKSCFPAVAVTLSLGEKPREVYALYREAGADRYLLRHETYDKAHYEKLHPTAMSWENRIRCLYDLRDLGYQVGTGFMVGSPYQTEEHLVRDLMFIQEFHPHMVGIGPFIPHRQTKFAQEPAGSVELTLFLLALLRLLDPKLLLPATTALNTIDPRGRKDGILAGANVVMPNLSPDFACENYELYDNKKYSGLENAAQIENLRLELESIGYEIKVDRGDYQ